MGVEPVGGGCIHRTVRVRGEDGRRAFLKWSPGVPGTLFPSEAEGLQALARSAEATGLRIPAVVGYGGGGDVPGWLLMEWLEPGPIPPGGGARLGRGLARLHEPLPGGWGWSGYQLHPLLVHLVLFGRGYEPAVLERVRRLARS